MCLRGTRSGFCFGSGYSTMVFLLRHTTNTEVSSRVYIETPTTFTWKTVNTIFISDFEPLESGTKVKQGRYKILSLTVGTYNLNRSLEI